jgi:hypothetical protein
VSCIGANVDNEVTGSTSVASNCDIEGGIWELDEASEWAAV